MASRKRSTPAGSAAQQKSKAQPKPRAASKAERELDEIEAVFAALSNASRRQILMVLHFRGGELTAGEIAKRFACAWPTTTRHLGVLQAAGLVSVIKRGRERVYRLEDEQLSRVTSRWLDVFEASDG